MFAVGPSLATVVFSLTNVTGVSGATWNWVGVNNYTDFLFGGNARDNQDILIRTAETAGVDGSCSAVSPYRYWRPA
jgi:raffinose/stachyose/melibiose transport system permease protein